VNKKLKTTLQYFVFIAIGGGMLYLAFRKTDPQELVANLLAANWWYVLLSMALGFAAFVSRGFRWGLLLRPMGYKLSDWSATHAISMGYLANAAVPRAGEIIRCTTLSKAEKIPLEKLVGTVVAERIVDLVMLLTSIGLSVAFNWSRFQTFYNEAILGGTAETTEETTGISLKWLVLSAMATLGILTWIFRNKIKELPFFQKIISLLLGFKEGILSLAKTPHRWAFIGHSIFIWTCYYLMVHVVIYALPETAQLNPIDSLFIMVVAGLGMLVPSPGGIGSYHYAVMVGMGILGIKAEAGMAFATLVHSGQFVMTITAGIVAAGYFYAFNKKKTHANP